MPLLLSPPRGRHRARRPDLLCSCRLDPSVASAPKPPLLRCCLRSPPHASVPPSLCCCSPGRPIRHVVPPAWMPGNLGSDCARTTSPRSLAAERHSGSRPEALREDGLRPPVGTAANRALQQRATLRLCLHRSWHFVPRFTPLVLYGAKWEKGL